MSHYATADKLQGFLKTKTPLFPYISLMYVEMAAKHGVDVEDVFCHAIVCTDYFRSTEAAKNDFYKSGLRYNDMSAGAESHCIFLNGIGGVDNTKEAAQVAVTKNRFEEWAGAPIKAPSRPVSEPGHAPNPGHQSPPPPPSNDAKVPPPVVTLPLPPPAAQPTPKWRTVLLSILGVISSLSFALYLFLPAPAVAIIKTIVAALKEILQIH